MCAQCMVAAATAGAAATGLRAWLGARRPEWLTPARMRALTVAILIVGVTAAGTQLSGAAPPVPDAPALEQAPAAPEPPSGA